MKINLLFACLILIPFAALAEDSDDKVTAQNALNDTQKMMKSKEKRKEFLKSSPAAQENDKKVGEVVNGDAQAKEEIYSISSEVLAEIMEKDGGDPDKLNETIEKAQKDPEAFYKTLSEKTRKKIQAVSKRTEKQK